jgi:hypothetical protein
MEELLKIADQYNGGQNITMFIPANDNIFKHISLLLRESCLCVNQMRPMRPDDGDIIKLSQCHIIIGALLSTYMNEHFINLEGEEVSSMGVILYGGIKRHGAGYQMYVEHYIPQNNPVTRSLYLMDCAHHLRDELFEISCAYK